MAISVTGLVRYGRRAPRLVVVWLTCLCCLGLTLASECGTVRLADASGFPAACRYLTTIAPEFVVVWPPHVRDGLAELPASLRAADAVPVDPQGNRRFSRIAVLGPAGFPTPPELTDARAEPRTRFEDVEVGLFTYAAEERVLFDLRRSLAEVRVELIGGAGLACDIPRPDGGWSCPGRPEWNYVGPVELRVNGEGFPAVWAHPVADLELTLDLGERPLGDRIELQAALSDDAALTRGGAPVTLRLAVTGPDGVVHQQTLQRSNATGVATLVLPTPAMTSGHVRLAIRTANDARRHLGINLKILATPTAPSPPGGR